MSTINLESVNKFNQTYSDDSLIKLKIISSYFSEYPMNMLALYIKVLECFYTLKAITDPSRKRSSCHPNEGIFRDICKEILPYCSLREQNTLNSLLSFYDNMANMQEMMQMMELMQEMGGMGDGNGNEQGNSMDLTEILSMMSAFTS